MRSTTLDSPPRRPGSPALRRLCATAAGALALTLLAPGCIVIPIGDLLKGPPLEEQVLVEGEGGIDRDKVALVEVSGVISSEASAFWGDLPDPLSEIKTQLDEAAADPEVHAVVLRVSSPGGEVTACDILHREIRRLREKEGIPVVAVLQDVGASGGYYVACGADRIVAHPTAIVGSIGVLFRTFDLSGLLEKVGVRAEPVKSTAQKDLLSVFRSRTPEERRILQDLVDDMYQRFVDVVERGRPQLEREAVLELADGRVVSGAEAVRLGLVDTTGYMSDAIDEAAELGGVDSPTVVRYTRRARSGANVYTGVSTEAAAGGPAAELRLRWPGGSAPRLYYLWRP